MLRKDVLWLWLPVARPDAYIFDHDGVIADTQGLHAAIESQMLAAFGIDITAEEITRRYSGVSMRVMFPELFADRGKEPPNVEQLVEEKYRLIMKSIDQVRPIDGTIHLIRRIHAEGVPMAVGSASRKLFLDAVLQKLGIERMFRAIATGHEVPHGKPAPDIFLLAAKRLDIEPRKCVVVEDSYHGMEAAKRAGMKCIALDNGTQPHIDADWVFKDLRYLDLDAIRI